MANEVERIQAEPELQKALYRQESEAATLMQVISRAATDPACDIEKMERLMLMHERMQARQAETDFSAAFAQMQTALPSIGERGSVTGRYTYALWEDINAAIKPVLSNHGFALSFRIDTGDGVRVTGVLSHEGGHSIETTITLPVDSSGNKPAVQAVASATSYGKRYTAGALLNLTSHGEDDDAFAAATIGYDCTDWIEAIMACTDEPSMKKLADELRTKTEIPGPAMKKIRKAWVARMAAIKAKSNA